MNTDKFLDILNYIVCSILSVSIFLFFVPTLTDSLKLIILCVQIFVIIYLHNALNTKKSYYFFTSLLGVSNVAFSVISYIITKNGIKAIESTPQTNDIFTNFMLELSYTLVQYVFVFILIITAIVVIECAISMVIKHKCFNKAQTSSEHTNI